MESLPRPPPEPWGPRPPDQGVQWRKRVQRGSRRATSQVHRARNSDPERELAHRKLRAHPRKAGPAPLPRWAGTAVACAAFVVTPQVPLATPLPSHAPFRLIFLIDQWALIFEATPPFCALVSPWLRLLWLRSTAARWLTDFRSGCRDRADVAPTPPPSPPRDVGRNPTEQIGRSEEKGKVHRVAAPRPSPSPTPMAGPWPESLPLLRHTGLGSPRRVRAPPPKSCQSAPPPQPPSPRPRQSPPGDFGLVLPGLPAPDSALTSCPPKSDLPGLFGLASPRT